MQQLNLPPVCTDDDFIWYYSSVDEYNFFLWSDRETVDFDSLGILVDLARKGHLPSNIELYKIYKKRLAEKPGSRKNRAKFEKALGGLTLTNRTAKLFTRIIYVW